MTSEQPTYEYRVTWGLPEFMGWAGPVRKYEWAVQDARLMRDSGKINVAIERRIVGPWEKVEL